MRPEILIIIAFLMGLIGLRMLQSVAWVHIRASLRKMTIVFKTIRINYLWIITETFEFGYSSVNILEIVYTRSTLFNFVSSSFLICLTGFNVVVNIHIVECFENVKKVTFSNS